MQTCAFLCVMEIVNVGKLLSVFPFQSKAVKYVYILIEFINSLSLACLICLKQFLYF